MLLELKLLHFIIKLFMNVHFMIKNDFIYLQFIFKTKLLIIIFNIL
jgi:hypothetical protein